MKNKILLSAVLFTLVVSIVPTASYGAVTPETQTQIDALNIQITATKDEIASTDAQVVSLQAKIVSLKAKLQSLNDQLSKLLGSNVATSSVISSLTIKPSTPSLYKVLLNGVTCDSSAGLAFFLHGSVSVNVKTLANYPILITRAVVKAVDQDGKVVDIPQDRLNALGYCGQPMTTMKPSKELPSSNVTKVIYYDAPSHGIFSGSYKIYLAELYYKINGVGDEIKVPSESIGTVFSNSLFVNGRPYINSISPVTTNVMQINPTTATTSPYQYYVIKGFGFGKSKTANSLMINDVPLADLINNQVPLDTLPYVKSEQATTLRSTDDNTIYVPQRTLAPFISATTSTKISVNRGGYISNTVGLVRTNKVANSEDKISLSASVWQAVKGFVGGFFK